MVSNSTQKENIRGLAVFISDIRGCKSKEQEVKRVNKELANIRGKFKGDKALDGYAKKKYVCKLLFIFLLGHDIDFGHMEAVALLNSNRYSEKHIGYLFISILVSVKCELMKLIISNLKQDISSKNPIYVNLALHCIANVASSEFAEEFADEIPKLLLLPSAEPGVKQSASLCLLRLLEIRYKEAEISGDDSKLACVSEWGNRVVHLLNDQHLGVVTSACSLLIMLADKNPSEFKSCINLAASRLSRIVNANHSDFSDYSYYFIPTPWLCVKLLRLLQCFPPTTDHQVKIKINECLTMILNKQSESAKCRKIQHINAKHAVLFEAINLIFHMDSEANLFVRAANTLGNFLTAKETNIRYMALDALCMLATSEHSRTIVEKHRETVVKSLKTERDISVRKRAVDLLYAICENENAQQIVAEMLKYLENADFSIREELVLKIAILSERYATDYTWYVDTILSLIRIAGDHISEEVWHRVVQIVVNKEQVQGYSAKVCYEALQQPTAHENMIKVAGYILGEFGNLIAADSRSTPIKQFNLLHGRFHLCSLSTRCLLLTTYVKFINLFPDIKTDILKVMKSDNILKSADVELQQRALEYTKLVEVVSRSTLADILVEMPHFSERESSVLNKLWKTRPNCAKIIERTDKSRSHTPSSQISGGRSGSPSKKPQINLVQEDKIAENKDTLIDFDQEPSDPPPQYNNAIKLTKTYADSNHSSDFSNPGINNTRAPDPLAGLLGPGNVPTPNTTNKSPIDLLSSNDPFQINKPEVAPVFETVQIPLNKFVCKTSGVLYESDSIQVGLRAEFKPPNAKVTLYFVNKTSTDFENFCTKLEDSMNMFDNFKFLDNEPMAIKNHSQVPKTISCIFNGSTIPNKDNLPTLSIWYSAKGEKAAVKMQIPLFVTKFITPAPMVAKDYFSRWQLLSQPNQQQQVIKSMGIDFNESNVINEKLENIGLSILSGVDPNGQNIVTAGICTSSKNQAGILIRLEPNMVSKQYRLTIRSNNPSIGSSLCDLMVEQF